jgi:diguanylate cyclase
MQRNPTEIARETLKQLAVRRVAPTPDHYEAIYHEIARTPEEDRLHPGLRQMVSTISEFPRQTPELQRQIRDLRKAASNEDWPALTSSIIQCIQSQGTQLQLTRTWSELIRDLIRQWDLRSASFTPSRKKASLETVLINFGNDPEQLNEKLAGLIKSWAQGVDDSGQGIETSGQEFPIPDDGTAGNWRDWQAALQEALQIGVAARLAHNPDLQNEALALANAVRVASQAGELDAAMPHLRKFWLRLELQNDQETRLCDGLMNLLRLLTDNMAEVAIDDEWIKGQIAVVKEIMKQPLDMRVIYDTEAGLKEVLFKQGQIKHSLQEAQTALKSMLATFIDRLGGMADSTDQFHSKISQYSDRVRSAQNLPDIKDVLEGLMQDTRTMQIDVLRSRDDLLDARRAADEAEQRIHQLENELATVSAKVREDQLTGALNRRGMEEAFEVEQARAQRSKLPFSLALLDIDNFKKLNDRLGHGAGDQALVHLVKVIQDLLRPTDSVARYGGEEFVLLLPETKQDEAIQVVQRLQRELTRRFFLHNNEKLLITFSAGITEVNPGEARTEALERADSAMYRAKKAGKNRVEIA